MFGLIFIVMTIISGLGIISACIAISFSEKYMDNPYIWGTRNNITTEDDNGEEH